MAKPRTGLAAVTDAELADLERLWQSLELPGYRVELIDGQIIVPCQPDRAHPRDQRAAHPDLAVVPKDAPGLDENESLGPGVVLVAGVVSPHSRREDREVKPQACARGGIVLYLLIDRLADPPGVTLFSQPGAEGYARRQTAAAGRPLRLPKPFGITLDTARLLG